MYNHVNVINHHILHFLFNSNVLKADNKKDALNLIQSFPSLSTVKYKIQCVADIYCSTLVSQEHPAVHGSYSACGAFSLLEPAATQTSSVNMNVENQCLFKLNYF